MSAIPSLNPAPVRPAKPVTVLAPPPKKSSSLRVWVWLALVVGELTYITPWIAGTPFVASHLIERVGLFIMIVLGESVVELILAVHLEQSALAWAVSAGAFLLVCAIWWHYYQAGAPMTERMLAHSSGVVLRDVILSPRAPRPGS